MTLDGASNAKKISEEASLWVIKKDRGLSDGEQRELDKWLSCSRCREEFERFDCSWAFLDLSEPEESSEKQTVWRTVAQFPRSKWAGRVAGIAALILLGLFLPKIFWNEENQEYFAHMKAGEVERNHLPDGSLVALNAETEAEFKIDSDERAITLVSGEAHFDVAKDRDRPFVVMAGGIEVRAIGTAFNVRYVDDGIEVLVTEGTVQLSRIEEIGQETAAPVNTSVVVLEPDLTVNELSVVPFAPEEETIVETLDEDESIARVDWKVELLELESVALSEVIDILNSCNRARIELENKELGERLIDVSIRSDALDEFVALVSLTHNLGATWKDDSLIVLSER